MAVFILTVEHAMADHETSIVVNAPDEDAARSAAESFGFSVYEIVEAEKEDE
jgi:hypothetical protein